MLLGTLKHLKKNLVIEQKLVTMNVGATYDKEHLNYYKRHAENFLHDMISLHMQTPYKYILFERDIVYIKHLCETKDIKLINYTYKMF